MDDKDWIFGKMPNWLRWIVLLPASFVLSILFTMIFKFTYGWFLGYGETGAFMQIGTIIANTFGFLIGIFFCVPNHKGKITGSFSILGGTLYAVAIGLWINRGHIFIMENLINLIMFGLCMYYGIMLIASEVTNNPIINDDNISA